MALCLRVFCLLLICASLVGNVEPKYKQPSKYLGPKKTTYHTTKRPRYDTHTKKPHKPVYEPTSKPTKHTGYQDRLSDGPGYSSESRTHLPKTGNQVKRKSGDGPVTSPPAIQHTTQPSYRPPALEPISTQTRLTGSQTIQNNLYSGGSEYPSRTLPSKTGNQEHGYPSSPGKSGVGPETSPPTAHNLHPQTTPKPQASHQYAANPGLSGESISSIQQQALKSSSYPSANGLSGNENIQESVPGTQLLNNPNLGHGYTSSQGKSGMGSVQASPEPHFHPTNISGGSYSAVQHLNSQTSSYHSNSSLSGTGQILQSEGATTVFEGSSRGNKLPSVQTHSYPTSNEQSGVGHKSVVQDPQQGTGALGNNHTTHGGYFEPSNNNHIYIRNHHITNIHSTNIQTTHSHHHYRPPSHVSYLSNGLPYHYPIYKDELPVYVYEYKSSRSRFSTLLTGLALYNLGHLARNNQSRQYHKQYMPSPNEICKFGVKYDSVRYDEVDIDCRLITYFIWFVKKSYTNPYYSYRSTRGPKSIQVVSQVNDALDPRFDGVPLQIQPYMKCYMKYADGYFTVAKKYVKCSLLETLIKKSFNSASTKDASTIFMVATSIALAMLY